MDMEEITTKLGVVDINADQNSRYETRNYNEKAEEFFDQYFKTQYEKKGCLMIPKAFLYKNPMPSAVEAAPEPERKKKNKSDKDNSLGDAAEHKIYECLQNITHDKIIAIRDFKFNLQKKKNQNQQDFIIFYQRGVMMIECKGIKSDSTKKTGGRKKAKKQLHKDRTFFQENFSNYPVENIKLVVGTPTLKKTSQQERFDGEYYYMFEEDVKDDNAFKAWWDDVTKLSPIPDFKDIQNIAKRYILYAHLAYDPDVKANENNVPIRDTDVNNTVAEQTTNIQYLLKTPEQREVSEDKTLILNIEGPAGSGKTVLLEEKVRSIRNNMETQDDSILVLCYHRPLAAKLQANIGANKVTVSSFIEYVRGLQKKKNRNNLDHKRENMNKAIAQIKPCITDDDKYDHILIDEGQDFQSFWWEFLKQFILKDPYHGVFWMFFDSFQKVEKNADAHLINSEKRKLTQVVRTTREIQKYACKYDPRKSKLAHEIQGIPVDMDPTEAFEDLKTLLNELVHEGVKCKDITVLFKSRERAEQFKKYCGPGVKEEAEEAEEEDDDLQEEMEYNTEQEEKDQENEVDTPQEQNVRGVPQFITSSTKFQNAEQKAKGGSHITLDGMIRFKGMEDKYIILFDPKVHRKYRCEEVKDTLYTAFTRSFCKLNILAPKESLDTIKTEKGFTESEFLNS